MTDSSGAVVPDAVVILDNATNGFQSQRKTDGKGEYVFSQIPPGTYTIKVIAPGFADQSKTAELLVNQPATIPFTLSVQASITTVDVTAAAQTLNLTDATIGNSVNNAVIQALPMEGRNVPDLLSLQPGVLYLNKNTTAQNVDSRTGAVAGARADQGNVTLDGLDDNDQVSGYAFTGVLRSTLDSTQEFRVTTTNANAESGRSSGAQVSLVTKSGTNQFHGSAYEYNRSTLGLANDWFVKQGQLASGLPHRPGKLIRNTFGASLGGPIRRDKLFFFFNYEGQRTAENQPVTRQVPTASFRAGNLTYQDASGGTTTLTANQVALMDQNQVDENGNNCTANGTCSWGPGPDPNVTSYFQQYPLNNGFTEGDGYNTGSYTFSSPFPGSLNTSIFKLDYAMNDKNHFFIRGNLQKDRQAGLLQFPGQPPRNNHEDNTKGLAAGYTWSPTSSLVNDVRYGYIRQGYSTRGVGQGDYVDFRFLDQLTAETRSTVVNVPVHNIVDNLNWTKGKHTLQVGVNWRLIHNNRGTDNNSYNVANTNPYWLGGSVPEPSDFGFAGVNEGFGNSYQIAYATLTGTVPQLTKQFNYQVSGNGSTGTQFADGAFINRHFKSSEFEYYIQDSWRVQPNLTLTFGIRHSILQTPYETNGQEIAPTVDTHAWFTERQAAASKGLVDQPSLAFTPVGPVFGRPGYWSKQKLNIAPRFSIAYAPDNKTSIRAGFGMFYDHFGQGIVNTFDQNGSFGLTTALENSGGVQGYATSPRFTGRHNLPALSVGAQPASTVTYPYTPPNLFQITWGIDKGIKTPYSEAFDLSVQREIPGGFTLETAYVGRLGRHLLQALDLAEPVDFVDSKTGVDYFAAGAQLSRLVDANAGNTKATVAPIQYFEDVFPLLAQNGMSATQFIYTNEWAPYRYSLGETTSLADIDFFCSYGCPTDATGNAISRFWQSQFSSLYAWSTIGMSYYNSGQIILRHPASHGLQMDFSYTLSKSIDMGSDTERATEIDSTFGSFSDIINSWKPSLNRGVSDFDTHHLITVDWVYKLPFGRGQYLGSKASRWTDALIGGWQWSGLNRWTSGLPFSLYEPGWTTNWQIEANAVTTGKVKVHRHLDSSGNPQVFADPAAINNGVTAGFPIRLPYPGEAGERNNFRGDGYFDIDSGLAKTWHLYENQILHFGWEVFNVTNSVRFDTAPTNVTTAGPALNGQLTSGTLGVYTATLTQPRRMQLSLRYDF